MQNPQGQGLTGLPAKHLQRLAGTFGSAQQFPGMAIQAVRRQRGAEPTPLALKQLHLQVLLQMPHLLRERRLRQTQPFGGAPDMGFLVERDEIAQLAQIHKHSL